MFKINVDSKKENHSFLSYVLSIFLTFLALAFSGNMLFKLIGFNGRGVNQFSEMIQHHGKNMFFFVQILPFFFALVVLLFCIKFIHNMDVKKLIHQNKNFNFKAFFLSFFLLGIFLILVLFLDIFITKLIEWNFSSPSFFYLLLICLIFVSLQTFFEELLFRAYLLQGLQKAFHKPLISIIISSFLFAMMHINNPEIGIFGKGIIFYFAYSAIFLALVTFYSKGIEISFGFHAMNNLFATLILTNDWQVFQTDALFKNTGAAHLGLDFWITVFVIYPIIFITFMKIQKWNLGLIFDNEK
jgi:membrane protease YdiL (CAAX protease family)